MPLTNFNSNGIWAIDNDVGEVLTNGAHREVLPDGQAFYNSATWYTSPAKTQKIREEIITRNAQGLPTTIVTNIYNREGSLSITVTDTVTYTNNVESTRSRAIVQH